MHLQKYLYRTLWAVLIFYKNILKDIDSQGLEMNLYDLCVVHKMVNDKQMMIV